MGLSLYVHLEDNVTFDSKSEQDRLAEDIDSETFIAPTFVGVDKGGRVVVRSSVTTLDTDVANQVGDIIATHFDSTVKRVQLDSA